jgi:hypothetical protein
MGLDMYLFATRYFWINDSERSQKIALLFPELVEEKGDEMEDDIRNPIKQVEANIGYWRKCYPIHMWFVKHVQKEIDDCRTYELSEKNLTHLLCQIDNVLNDHNQASILLPNPPSMKPLLDLDYNEGYFESLEYTKKKIQKALRLHRHGWDISYSSSW